MPSSLGGSVLWRLSSHCLVALQIKTLQCAPPFGNQQWRVVRNNLDTNISPLPTGKCFVFAFATLSIHITQLTLLICHRGKSYLGMQKPAHQVAVTFFWQQELWHWLSHLTKSAQMLILPLLSAKRTSRNEETVGLSSLHETINLPNLHCDRPLREAWKLGNWFNIQNKIVLHKRVAVQCLFTSFIQLSLRVKHQRDRDIEPWVMMLFQTSFYRVCDVQQTTFSVYSPSSPFPEETFRLVLTGTFTWKYLMDLCPSDT